MNELKRGHALKFAIVRVLFFALMSSKRRGNILAELVLGCKALTNNYISSYTLYLD